MSSLGLSPCLLTKERQFLSHYWPPLRETATESKLILGIHIGNRTSSKRIKGSALGIHKAALGTGSGTGGRSCALVPKLVTGERVRVRVRESLPAKGTRTGRGKTFQSVIILLNGIPG